VVNRPRAQHPAIKTPPQVGRQEAVAKYFFGAAWILFVQVDEFIVARHGKAKTRCLYSTQRIEATCTFSPVVPMSCTACASASSQESPAVMPQ